MKTKVFTVFALAAFVILIGGCATFNTVAWTPLPDKINIVAPSADLDNNLANLMGIWRGESNGGLKITLVIEKIDLQNAVSAIYSWGDILNVTTKQFVNGGWIRLKGMVEGNKIKFKIPKSQSSAVITVSLIDVGAIRASYTHIGVGGELSERFDISLYRKK